MLYRHAQALLLLLPCALHAQAPYQLAWDTLTTDLPLIEASVPTPSGGQFVLTRGTSDSIAVLHKFDANGQPLWSRTMTGPTALARVEAIASDGGEGLFAVRPVRQSRHSTFGPDTFHVEVARIGPDGDPVLARTVEVVAERTSIFSPSLYGYRLLAQSNGALYLCLLFQGSPSHQLWVFKLDPDGDLEWSRTIGNNDVGGFPTIDADRLKSHEAASDGQGGLVIGTRGYPPPSSPFTITRMDGNGQVQWMNRYAYGNSVIMYTLESMALDGQGRIATYTHLQTSTGVFAYLMRTGLDGVPVQADLYDVMVFEDRARLHTKSDGGMFAAHWPYNERFMNAELRGLELDANGGVLSGTWRTIGSVVPHRFNHMWAGSGIAGNRLLVAGTLVTEHNVLATQEYRPLLTSYSLGGPLNGCLLAQANFMRHPVPLNVITTTPLTPYQRDMADRFSVTPAAWSSVPAPMPRVVDLCAFTSGMPEAGNRSRAFRIVGNPVPAGQDLELRGVEAGTIRVFNAMGSLVAEARATAALADLRIGMPDAGSGAHLVQWTAADGAMRHAERFVVQ